MQPEIINGHSIRCYFNSESQYCFTVVYLDKARNNGTYSARMMTTPLTDGRSEYKDISNGEYLGKRIPFDMLPFTLQQTVRDDMDRHMEEYHIAWNNSMSV